MINGNYDIYDIAPDGTRKLVAESSNAVIASSWNIPLSGVSKTEDIVLLKDFGSGVDLRKVLAEKRIIRAFARDISRLEQDIININGIITDMEITKAARQKELDDTLAEIEALKQEIIDSEQLIVTSRTRLEELKTEIPAAKRNVQLKRDEITQLLRQKALLENDVRRYTEQIADQENLIRNINIDIDDIKVRILRQIDGIASNADIQALNTQKTDTINRITNLEGQISDKRAEIDVVTTEFHRLRDIWIQKDTDGAPDAPSAKSDMDIKQQELSTLESNLAQLEADKVQQQQFLANIDQRIIDKGIELQPELKILGEQKTSREQDLAQALLELDALKKQLKTSSEGVTASDENKVIKEQELAQLEKIVSDKEQEQIDTQTAMMQAQVVIVSNTNSIPVKELSIPVYQEALQEIIDQINDKIQERTEAQERIDEITRVKNSRESEINNVAQTTWTPFEYRTDTDSYSSIDDWHTRNLSEDELAELGGETMLIRSSIIGGVPNIIRHEYEDGQAYYGLFWCAISELQNAALVLSEAELPASISSAFKLASHVKSTGAGPFRNYLGQKLKEEGGKSFYRRIYHISKMHSEPGSYSYLGVTYGDHLLSIAKINRRDDAFSSQLILNAEHHLEVNYIFDIIVSDEAPFEYEFELDGKSYTAKATFDKLKFNVTDNGLIPQPSSLVDFVMGEYSVSLMNISAQILPNMSLNMAHKRYHINSNNVITENKTPATIDTIIAHNKYSNARITFKPTITLFGMDVTIPLPLRRDMFNIDMNAIDGKYIGREYEYIPENIDKTIEYYKRLQSS